MAPRHDELRREVQSLRDWKHRVAVPKLTALEGQLQTTVEMLRQTAATVAEMRDEAAFAKRVAAEMRKKRWQALSKIEKAALFVVAILPLADFGLRLAGVF